ncbi:hypothetical protein [Arthrobacter sp. AZCC_0090]|uniref:hypothetical protein n=1 Tax=Arthrobacter sp. AZCC_0090 TaxID=2735881 RepID=UPI001622DBB2|nr:hypothetical protein [Arthrobacter sp. AZCC_0090]MBB6404729.1 hypothetical protein [Arthrobacter sp. AZCC_0090]
MLSVEGGVRLAERTSQEPPRETEFRAQLGVPRTQENIQELGVTVHVAATNGSGR